MTPLDVPEIPGRSLAFTPLGIWRKPRHYVDGDPVRFSRTWLRGQVPKATVVDVQGRPHTVEMTFNLFDPMPVFAVDGRRMATAPPLRGLDTLWCTLPAGLLFVGGILGAIVGSPVALMNVRLFRASRGVWRYVLTGAATVAAGAVYAVLAYVLGSG